MKYRWFLLLEKLDDWAHRYIQGSRLQRFICDRYDNAIQKGFVNAQWSVWREDDKWYRVKNGFVKRK